MKRILFIALTLLTISSGAVAQQFIQQSQFFNNLQAINPAYSGWKNTIELRSGYRKQWTNFNDSPENYFMSFHIPINNPDEPRFTNYSLRVSNPELYKELVEDYLRKKTKIKFGIGGYLVTNNQSFYSKTSAAVTYSVHYGIAGKYHISAGVATGFNRFGFNYDKILVASDEELAAQDIAYQNFVNQPDARTGFDMSAGMTFYGKNFHISYAATQLIPNRQLGSEDLKQNETQHYITGGYTMKLTDRIKLEPTLLVQVNGVGISYLGNVLARYRQFWGGVGYGANKQMTFLAGMKVFNYFHLGYAYDYSFSGVRNYNQGSHEVVLGMDLPRFPASILNAFK